MFAHRRRWHAVGAGLVLGVAVGAVTLACNSPPSQEQEAKPVQGQKKPPPAGDYKPVVFVDLGIVLQTPKEDKKTGFVVAGRNPTYLIRGLKKINGQSIATLEKDMRPDALSKAGFLGKDEALLDVLARDNDYVVEQLGMSHQELARHLYALEAIWHKLGGKATDKEPIRCIYCNRRFEITLDLTRGLQKSPFRDDTRTNAYLKAVNVDNGQKLEYSCLVPAMVERYGFYEGTGTSFRVEPKQILEVCDFLKPAPK